MTVIQVTFVFFAIMAIYFADISSFSQEEGNQNVRKLARANNKLALNMYHQLASKSSENIFFSPFSLYTAFGMLYHGSRGLTAQELRRTLGYGAAHLPKEIIYTTFQYYLTQVLPNQDTKAYVISASNVAILDRNFEVLSPYKKDIRDYFQGTIKEVDFSAKNQKAVQEVNKFVREKTNGKIQRLLKELDPSTVFLLLNAVYFKGTWKTKFERRDTRPRKFYNKGVLSGAKDVPMMKLKGDFLYTSDYGLKVDVIDMPYKGENISMTVLLPHERGGLEALEKSLSLLKLKNILRQLRKSEVSLTFPKFKVQYAKEMKSDFKALGAYSLFSPGAADFSGMTQNKNIYVNEVAHKAVLEVNEEGSEAAAATSVRVVTYSIPTVQVFHVDHPFLFAIVDKRNDMILFLGRVTNL